MLRNFLFFVTFLVTVTGFAAPTNEARTTMPSKAGISIIPTFGLNTFAYRGEDVDSNMIESTGGLMFGVLAEKQFGSALSMGTGLVYQQTGAEMHMTSDDLELDLTQELTSTYLAVPVYVKYILIENNSKLFVRAGAQFGVLTRARSEIRGTDWSGSYETEEDVYRYYNTLDVMLQPAMGFEIPVAENASILFDVSFNYGLTKVIKDTDDHVRNQGFNFLSGFALNL